MEEIVEIKIIYDRIKESGEINVSEFITDEELIMAAHDIFDMLWANEEEINLTEDDLAEKVVAFINEIFHETVYFDNDITRSLSFQKFVKILTDKLSKIKRDER